MTVNTDGAQPAKTAVLFVCLGNICRSTMAEGVFRSAVAKGPYRDVIGAIDSCGTAAYHTGSQPDERTLQTLNEHGITDYTHRARQVRATDFDRFDYIFAMDQSNLANLERLRGEKRARVMLWGAFAEEDGSGAEVVEDPYYGGQEGFERVFAQCVRFSGNFLRGVLGDVGGKGEVEVDGEGEGTN